MYNRIILVGNLTREIEMHYTQGGVAIAKTGLATSRKFTKDGIKHEDVCFVDVTFFGRSAEVANSYLRKGSKVLIEGRLNFEQWADQNGGKRSKHSVTVENMTMLDSRDDSAKAAQPDKYPSHQPQQQTPQQQTPPQGGYDQQQSQQGAIPDIDEDEIPF
jgi:single-strand DNA-binding protein